MCVDLAQREFVSSRAADDSDIDQARKLSLADAGGIGGMQGDDEDDELALALAGGLAASGYLMMSRSVRPSLDFGAYSAATMAGAWVVLALVVVVSGVPLSGYEASAWGLFAAMAFGPQLLGHGSLVWALRWVGADVVAVVLLGEPIGAALLAWYVLGEVPPDAAWMGGPLLLVGIGIVLSAGPRAPEGTESTT